MDKRNIVVIIALIISCFILICALFNIVLNRTNTISSGKETSTSKTKSSRDINSKLKLVKNTAQGTCYFPFNSNGKSYILFGYQISSYSDPDKSKMTISNVKYDNDSLIIEIYVQEESKSYNIPEGETIEDNSNNILWETIETTSKYSSVRVLATNPSENGIDDREVPKFNGGVVKKNDKCGYIDENGDLSIPYIYDGIYELSVDNYDLKDSTGKKLNLDYSNYVRINNKNGNGIATKQGDVLIECQYGIIGYYGENTFFVTKGDGIDDWQTGVVDINNNIVIDFKNGKIDRPAEFFTSSLYAEYVIYENGHSYYGIIDRNFNTVVEPIYSKVIMYSNELKESQKESYHFAVEKDGKSAVFDYSGRMIVDFCDKPIYQVWNHF